MNLKTRVSIGDTEVFILSSIFGWLIWLSYVFLLMVHCQGLEVHRAPPVPLLSYTACGSHPSVALPRTKSPTELIPMWEGAEVQTWELLLLWYLLWHLLFPETVAHTCLVTRLICQCSSPWKHLQRLTLLTTNAWTILPFTEFVTSRYLIFLLFILLIKQTRYVRIEVLSAWFTSVSKGDILLKIVE